MTDRRLPEDFRQAAVLRVLIRAAPNARLDQGRKPAAQKLRRGKQRAGQNQRYAEIAVDTVPIN